MQPIIKHMPGITVHSYLYHIRKISVGVAKWTQLLANFGTRTTIRDRNKRSGIGIASVH